MIPVKGIIIFFMKNTCGNKIKTQAASLWIAAPQPMVEEGNDHAHDDRGE